MSQTVSVTAALPRVGLQSQLASTGPRSLLTQDRKRIVSWRRRETPRGPMIVVTSDTPLNDYSSYADGERVLVRIPNATLAGARANLSGHGAVDMLVEESQDYVVVSVRVLQGSTVRISQSFNRLEIIVLIHDQAKS